MPLIPYLAERLHLIQDIRVEDLGPDIHTLDPALLARLAAFHDDGDSWRLPEGVKVHDLLIPGPHGEIPLRTYQSNVPSNTFVLWVHGGGFTSGTLDWPESHMVSAELSARSSATVVAVDYRLAGPDTRYPVPLDDVQTAWTWLSKYAREATPKPALILGGASAGAALALGVAVEALAGIDTLLLAYPFAHFPVPALPFPLADEMRQLPPLMRFPTETISGMVETYIGRIHSIPPRALPGHMTLSEILPRASILISEYDDLRPSGELLARQWADAGANVSVRVESGVPHGHLNRYPAMPGVSDSLEWFASAIRKTQRMDTK